MDPARPKKKPDSPRTEDLEDPIGELMERADQLTGGQMHAWTSEEASPEVLKQFWENVVAYEEADEARPLDLLVQGGLEVPPPGDLDEAALSQKLRELVQAMALHGIFLVNTNHLNDRELYTFLFEDALREEMMMPMGEDGPLGNWIVDVIGSGSYEDIYVDLKYYADEEERRSWAEHWPEDEMPEHEDPPYDRDRTLPQPHGHALNPDSES